MILQIAAVCASLAMHEGIVHEVYEDHLGNKTVGIGHLVRPEEPEYDLPIGSKVSEERIMELFAADCEEAYRGTLRVLDDSVSHPDPVYQIVMEMVFQLGVSGVLGFQNMRHALAHGDYYKAADEMIDSRWATQTPKRATALSRRMRKVHG